MSLAPSRRQQSTPFGPAGTHGLDVSRSLSDDPLGSLALCGRVDPISPHSMARWPGGQSDAPSTITPSELGGRSSTELRSSGSDGHDLNEPLSQIHIARSVATLRGDCRTVLLIPRRRDGSIQSLGWEEVEACRKTTSSWWAVARPVRPCDSLPRSRRASRASGFWRIPDRSTPIEQSGEGTALEQSQARSRSPKEQWSAQAAERAASGCVATVVPSIAGMAHRHW
jgi:hypothetical protein